MSPCCLSPMAGGGPGRPTYETARIDSEKKAATAKSPAELAAVSPGFAAAPYATAAAWAPDPKNPPLYFDLPTKDGVPQPEIVAKLTANAPLAFVDQYIGNLKQYRAIAMDVGDQDGLRFDATKLHEVLDSYGIVNALRFTPARTPAPLLTASRTSLCRSSARTFASRRIFRSAVKPIQ
jgi:hypothetical protein